MNGFTEFFLKDGALQIHTECYNGTAMHYADYVLTKENTLLLAERLNAGDALIKFLTKNFSDGIGILNVLRGNAIPYVLIKKGFEDTSTDV